MDRDRLGKQQRRGTYLQLWVATREVAAPADDEQHEKGVLRSFVLFPFGAMKRRKTEYHGIGSKDGGSRWLSIPLSTHHR